MPPPKEIVTSPLPLPLPKEVTRNASSMVPAPDPPEGSPTSAAHSEVETQDNDEGNKLASPGLDTNTNTESSQFNTETNLDSERLVKKIYAVSVIWEREQAARRRQPSESPGPVVENKPCLAFTKEYFNRYFCCCARQVGSMFFLMETTNGSPIMVAGPCWPFCAFVTVPLIAVLSGLVGYYIVSNPNAGLPWWFALIYYPIVVFVITVLFCVSCRDPGLMERVTDEEAADNGWFWNEQVGSFRPAGAMYCRECKALVYDYDHVCPWTGTAIGKGNMLQFKVFVFSVNVLCYLSVGLVIWQVMDKIT